MTTLGNTKLVDYGIQNEDSDIRAHVGVLAGKVYVYTTRHALDVLGNKKYPVRNVSRNPQGIITAQGYAVPVVDIKPATINAEALIQREQFSADDNESIKGEKAVNVVQSLLRGGRFPLPVNPVIVQDVEMQHKGLDIIVRGTWRIQVKCDYRCGHGHIDCTGNLFLQVRECNPFGYK